MKLPLILVEGHDVQFFGSKLELENYLESPDINRYSVFDANGLKLKLVSELTQPPSGRFFSVVQIGRVGVEEEGASEESKEDLQDALENFIYKVNGVRMSGDLAHLIRNVGDLLGYESDQTGQEQTGRR